MSGSTQERLYNLLPAIYRIRDASQDEALRALMAVLESELVRIERDIEGLYRDWFIETCAEWVVPYIGDLLGVRNLHSVESAGVFSQRAYVANTLRYRRRKGTVPVLEQLARDVTGWPARAVEFFERLITTQHVNHVRLHSVATPDLRDSNQLELLGGPFERAAHTAEVRRIASSRGKYNIPNIGLFLWRLQSYFVIRSTPRPVSELDDGRYTFSPLGNVIPLFNRPQTETEITHLAEEINVPGQLRRRALYNELEAYRETLVTGIGTPVTSYFGKQPVLQVFFDDQEEALRPEEIVICDLSGWDEAGWQPAASETFTKPDLTTFDTKVAVDPALGRLAILDGVTLPDQMQVSCAYGFSSDIGGGPYGRRQTLMEPASLKTWTVDQQDTKADYSNLTDALSDWLTSGSSDAIITITDNGTYAETISIEMTSKRTLVIQAADGKRPTLRLLNGSADLADLVVTGGDGVGAMLTLNGLWIEGGIRVEADSLDRLHLLHCTLVPGRGLDADSQPRRPGQPSVVAALPNADLQVEISHSIVGPLHLPDEITSLTIQDSIVHSPLRGGPARSLLALVSGNLSPFPPLSSGTPAVDVQIGDEGPHTATFAEKPTTLGQARDQLQAAIQATHSSPAFTAARVVTAANRLIVLPGTSATVEITPVGDDPTSAELRLTDGSERAVQALMSPPLSPFPPLSSPAPALNVTIGDEGPHPVTLAPVPASVAQARAQLHTAIRTAHTNPAFQNAIVASVADQLVVLPGTEETTVLFGATDDDQTTFLELGLYEDRPAIGASGIGQQPGPKTSLERVTIFGATYVRELTLASETIFTGTVTAQRRQAGCTRFSFVPKGSQVPRRYRCQPDLALADYAQKAGKSSADDLTDAQQAAVLARLTPTFTSERYGDPDYAQLSRTCAQEIRTGAEDGSEMGAFSHLKQPQRDANLRACLEEYLRFGLEAGIFYVT